MQACLHWSGPAARADNVEERYYARAKARVQFFARGVCMSEGACDRAVAREAWCF